MSRPRVETSAFDVALALVAALVVVAVVMIAHYPAEVVSTPAVYVPEEPPDPPGPLEDNPCPTCDDADPNCDWWPR